MPSQLGVSDAFPGHPEFFRPVREEELQADNDALMLAALAARNGQLLAEEALRRQTQALALAAHELRSPLMPIRTVASFLEHVVNLDELPRMGAVVARQVAHLSRLVDDLLDASRVATGKLHLRRGRVELLDVLDQAIETCRPVITARRQRFVTDVPRQSIALEGDAVRLVQVFTNLLHNASKYTPTGGGLVLTCVLEARAGRARAAIITISDNGIGISAETLPLVFEPFVQDAHAVGFSKEGLGIGLTLVRELVQAHAGSVTAESAGTDMGSRFTVTLPLA
jgi:signal transduction histidine kinase